MILTVAKSTPWRSWRMSDGMQMTTDDGMQMTT